MQTAPNKALKTFRQPGAIIIGTLLGTLVMAPRLLFVMQMDHYFHHYLGWRLIHGGLPYVGSFDQNFPGGAAIYALAILLFGESSLGFSVFDLLAQGFTCYLIARLTLRFDKAGYAAILAPLIYGLTYIGLGVWDTGQRDGFIAPMLIGFLILVTKDGISKRQWFGIGLLVGLMTLTRPMFILVGLLAFWKLFEGNNLQELVKSKAKPFISLILGAALLPLLVILLYVITGYFTELYDATILFNVDVYSKFRHGVNFRGSGEMTLVIGIGILSLVFFNRSQLKEKIFVLLATILSPISMWVQGQGDAHHMTPSYASAAVLAGIGLSALLQKISSKLDQEEQHRKFSFAVCMLFVGVILLRGWPRIPHNYINQWVHGVSLQEIYEQQRAGDVDIRDEFAVAEFIKRNTLPTDYIQIFSMRIWPYELANRLPPGRFQTHEHLIMQPRGQELKPVQLKWRKEFMADLTGHPPKYILVTTTDQLWLYPNAEASIDQLKRFPEFNTFLMNGYALDTVIGAFNIYQRR